MGSSLEAFFTGAGTVIVFASSTFDTIGICLTHFLYGKKNGVFNATCE